MSDLVTTALAFLDNRTDRAGHGRGLSWSCLSSDRARREITDQAYRLAAADLEQAAVGLRKQLDTARDVHESPAPRATAAAVKELLRLWDAATVDEKNRLLRRLVREVRVRRSVYYREPFRVEPGGRVQVEWL